MNSVAKDYFAIVFFYIVGLFLTGLLAKIAWVILMAGWNLIP